jgi:serine/threonine-protein kinase HipA
MRQACRYTSEALARWPLNTPVISCSLPMLPEVQDATVWVEGLLPEGDARALIASRFGVSSADAWMLLAHLGRDVAGALQIHTDDAELDRPESVAPLSDAELEEAVAGLPRHPLDIRDDSELSLAGVQDKMTLVAMPDGGWGRPVGGYPSTHILKVEDRRYPGLADLEHACLQLAAGVGLTTVTSRVETIAGLPCMIVSRYDRTVDASGTVQRVHQEDLCQAMGRSPSAHRGRGKYERHGGPSFRDAAELLRLWGPPGEREQLVRAMVFTVLIGNADAHGKNLSLLHPEPGQIRLSPLYDTVPTALFDRLPTPCAMTINSVFEDLAKVTRGDLVAEAAGRRRWGLPATVVEELVDSAVAETVAATKTVDVPDALTDHIERRAAELAT